MSGQLLVMKGITKRFSGVLALDRVDFEVGPGEVHVLLGENGAGKSTLMKILAGVYPPDEGTIELEGRPVTIGSPRHAQELGISIIYQEFNLIPHLSVAQNILLGREPRKGPFIDWAEARDVARQVLRGLGSDIDVGAEVSTLSVAEQQLVEIAKALSLKSKILAMDEPTACLTEKEIAMLFETIARLRREGVSVIYISHRLQEVHAVGDRVTVLRDGQRVGSSDLREVGVDELIRMMVGRELKAKFPKVRCATESEALRVENLSRAGVLHDVSLRVNKGEVVGLAGLVGAGRTELARAIFGVDPISSGRIYLSGREVEITSPSRAIELGLALIPEDRKSQGLCLMLPIRENITHAAYRLLFPKGLVRGRTEKAVCARFIRELGIATPDMERLVRYLSGGNQQKTVVAKWLCTKARVFIFDEPTRGIDVGAKVEIYEIMNALVKEGAAILMISSELPEILGMSDRLYVMREGRIVAELASDQTNQEEILAFATGREGRDRAVAT